MTNELHIQLAKLHIQSFKEGSFLSSLGENFLSVFYQALLKSKESICVYIINDESKLIGFGLGCIKSKGFYKRLIKQNLFVFLNESINILFSNPYSLFHIFKNLDKNQNNEDSGDYAELLSFAVLPQNRGKGIGRELLKKFEETAKLKGCKKISITTDYYENENVIEFYRNNGYNIFYEFKAYPNRRMYKMIKNLD